MKNRSLIYRSLTFILMSVAVVYVVGVAAYMMMLSHATIGMALLWPFIAVTILAIGGR